MILTICGFTCRLNGFSDFMKNTIVVVGHISNHYTDQTDNAVLKKNAPRENMYHASNFK